MTNGKVRVLVADDEPLARERLRTLLSPRLATSAEFGIDVDAKEAVLFALLAYETHQRRPANLPSATGARKPAILGKISPAG